MKLKNIFAVMLSVSGLVLAEQAKEKRAPEEKVVRAIQVEEPINVDGVLEEKTWQTPGYSAFVQSDPVDGAEPSEKTEVWVAYDDSSLYVAAFLHDSEPSGIRSRLGRRDDMVDSDWFVFAVDPYFDRRTGYQFAVNPAGSIMDMVLSNDVSDDDSWDGVWDWKTQVNDKGWTVEIRIPLHQLRFPKKSEYIWGVNFSRTIKRKNERLFFAWVPKEEIAYVSRFARLEGISGIQPGRHVEFLPYSVGQAEFKPAEAGNPFQTGKSYGAKAGFDFKLGLKSNLTLDATFNPDFGQVEVDPAVINLSAYESYYEEKRPFFIEGANIFNGFGRGGVYLNANINWPNPTFFYSRRIGRAPQGGVTADGYVDYPNSSSILGAFKLTGQLDSWNIGVISALTAREYAQIDALGQRFSEEVEPFSYYGVFRAQKDINKGQQGIGFMATGVTRDLRTANLEGMLGEKAFSLGVDGWAFLDTKRAWVIGGWIGGTRIEGNQESILGLQYSSTHYYQRPDASHVEVNPNATSLSGWGGRLNFAKQQGQFLFSFALGALSPGFNPNDAGFQYSGSDRINIHFLPGYQWTKPGKVFRNALVIVGPFWNFDFGGNKTWEGYLALLEGTLLNYWSVNTMLAYNPTTLSNTLTRGGPLTLTPPGYQVDLGLESDSRKAVVVEGMSSYYRRPRSGYEWTNQVFLRWKPASNVSLSFGPGLSREQTEMQWVIRVKDPLMMETYGTRYVFGRLHSQVLSTVLRLNWTFTPRLSLQVYLQPFIAIGSYDKFKELAEPRTFDYHVFGDGASQIALENGLYTVDPDGEGAATPFSFTNPDFNYKSLRGTLVFRWEYYPGSLIYIVWTQNRADFSHPGDFQLRRDFSDLLLAPGDNIFLVKITYRWSL